jgi:HK97 family phage prohead protease
VNGGPVAAADEFLYRSYQPDLEVKSGGDGRTIYGIAVPFNAPTRIGPDLVEQFSRGAFNHQLAAPQRVKFAREHMALGGELIGAASVLRDDPAGLYGEWRVSRTPTGDATLELVRDGALDQLSIAFRSRQHQIMPGGVVNRTKADLSEVAVVLAGAYGELATAGGVRSLSAGYPSPGLPVSAELLDLRASAEVYLTPGRLPELPDLETRLKAIRLGYM